MRVILLIKIGQGLSQNSRFLQYIVPILSDIGCILQDHWFLRQPRDNRKTVSTEGKRGEQDGKTNYEGRFIDGGSGKL